MGAGYSKRNRFHRSSGRYRCSDQPGVSQDLPTDGVYKGFELADTYGGISIKKAGRTEEDCQPGDTKEEDCQPGDTKEEDCQSGDTKEEVSQPGDVNEKECQHENNGLGLKDSVSAIRDSEGSLSEKRRGDDLELEQDNIENCPPEIPRQRHLETQSTVKMKIIIEDCKGSRKEITEDGQEEQVNRSQTKRVIPENPGTLVKSFPYVVLAKYNYTAVLEGELTFKKGDYMLLISKEDESWWLVRELVNNTYGFSPSSFLEVQEHI